MKKAQADHLSDSLVKFGLCEPIVINTDNTIIGGHQRIRSLKKLGEKHAEVYVPERELTDKEVEELNIRLNRNRGEFDWDILGNLWDLEDLLEWGFDQEELQLDLGDISDSKETKQKKVTITITFPNREQALEAEPMIHELMVHFPGATDKISL